MALDPQVRMKRLMRAAPFRMRYREGEDFFAWQTAARKTLSELVGYEGEAVAPDFRVEWVHEEDGYTETRFLFETEPEVTAIGHLLVPSDAVGKLPVIICLQGHSKGMHISLGRPIYPGDEKSIHGGDRDFALQIVRRGQIALALEQRAFGQRGGTPEGPACYQPAVQAMLMGQTLIGQRCRDISRAIDVLEANFPQADTSRVAVMGNSGGGTATIYAAALDPRVAAAMPSCAFCGFQASIGEQYHCLCNYVPGIMNLFDMGDLCALIAPRPLVIVNGRDDVIFPLGSALEQLAVTKAAYIASGAPNAVTHVTGSEGHRFYASLGWPEFDRLTGWRG